MHEEPEQNVAVGEEPGVQEVWTVEIALYDNRRLVVDFSSPDIAQEQADRILKLQHEMIVALDYAKREGKNFRLEEGQ